MNKPLVRRNCRPRRLWAETLEQRQMLHGGGMNALLQRIDANDDGVLVADEVSEAVWEKLSAADADGNGRLTQSELQDFAEMRRAERMEQRAGMIQRMHRGHRRLQPRMVDKASPEDRIDQLFESAGDDGLLSADEVSPKSWARISQADGDGDELISRDELTQHLEEARTDRLTKHIDRLFANDQQGDGLTEDEVPERKWTRLVEADANDDGTVTEEELRDHIAARHENSDDDGAAS